MGRIVGDTAVVVILLGASLQLDPEGNVPGVNVLRGTGATLTTYVYNTSPAGEGNAPQKAYAAAVVLLAIVLALNGAVGPDRTAHVMLRAASEPDDGPGPAAARAAASAWIAHRSRSIPPPTPRRAVRAPGGPERMRAGAIERQLRRQPRRQGRLARHPSGRGARADRPVRVRQDDAAADAQPAHRDDGGRDARGARGARRRRRRRARADVAAPPRGDGLPAAEPVPDVDLRQRRVCHPDPEPQAREPPAAAAAGGRRTAPRRPLRRGRRRSRPAGAAALRLVSSNGCASHARSPRGPRCC